ncbi:unnamed protein product, partial [Adineta ricciae]
MSMLKTIFVTALLIIWIHPYVGAVWPNSTATWEQTGKLVKADSQVPLRAPAIDIYPYAEWEQNGLTVAGGNGRGTGKNQLERPHGLFVDHDQTIYVADYYNNRIVEWKLNATSGHVVAGGNGQGNGNNQLYYPSDVIVDKETDSLIICDLGNNRIVRWPRGNGRTGETIISDISCFGLTMDNNGSLYVGNHRKAEVRRYGRGYSQGTVVASDNGCGNGLNRYCSMGYVFVDQDHSVYVSEWYANRVTKWVVGAKEGIVVAGGDQGAGNNLDQLSAPQGVVVDRSGTVYVVDRNNYRVMRWMQGAAEGTVIVNRLSFPFGLAFDLQGNLYVGDYLDDRVQKFNIKQF